MDFRAARRALRRPWLWAPRAGRPHGSGSEHARPLPALHAPRAAACLAAPRTVVLLRRRHGAARRPAAPLLQPPPARLDAGIVRNAAANIHAATHHRPRRRRAPSRHLRAFLFGPYAGRASAASAAAAAAAADVDAEHVADDDDDDDVVDRAVRSSEPPLCRPGVAPPTLAPIGARAAHAPLALLPCRPVGVANATAADVDADHVAAADDDDDVVDRAARCSEPPLCRPGVAPPAFRSGAADGAPREPTTVRARAIRNRVQVCV